MDAEGAHEGDVTIIRGVDSGDGIILAVFFLLAALGVVVSGVWYGSVVTIAVGVAFAVVVIGVWILLRDPHPVLTIGPDEIVLGRRLVVARDATGWLRVEWAGPESGWEINALDGEERTGWVPLGRSFDADEVADACQAHGWPVWRGQGGPPAPPEAARSRGRPKAAPRKTMSKPWRITVGTLSAVSFFVCLGALAVPNWYVAIASGIVMFVALGYSESRS